MESPSTSMDTLTSQFLDDSDIEVEAELPTLKQVLGEDTVRKLKPKEKKRQDVINGKSTREHTTLYFNCINIYSSGRLLYQHKS